MTAFKFALRMLAREWRAGELRLLALALVVAVGSLTTVAFFSERVRLALTQESSQLLGADLLVVSDRPIAEDLSQRATQMGLQTMQVVRFPSMAQQARQSVLADIKAIDAAYPLKGKLTVRTFREGQAQTPVGAPEAGAVWADERALARLSLRLGGEVTLGERSFRVIAELVDDPDTAIGFLNLGPRLIMNRADLAVTGLIQPGSRVSYRLGVAGDAESVQQFRQYAKARLGVGQRVEDVREARPEIRSALERAEKFLGLASLMSALIAAVAIGLAARRYLTRHLDSCAVMRCFGASQGFIVGTHTCLFALLALVASALGAVLGLGAQEVLASLMAPVVGVRLPSAGLMPALQGLLAGAIMLIGFALPPIIALRKVPTLRVLRRDLGLPKGLGAGSYLLGLGALMALILWQAQDLKLGAAVLSGIAGLVALSLLLTWGAMRALTQIGRNWNFAARFGLANLWRRPLGSLTQIVALGVGMMALMLLTLTRADLLESWRRSLPPDAPNRFLVNVQADQVEGIEALLSNRGLTPSALHPMVRARLVAINDRPISAASYTEDRAKRLVDREFNLSWSAALPTDNHLMAGRWFRTGDDPHQFSVEDGLAQTLGIRLHDRIVYDVAGQRLAGQVTSLRKVEWDSFKVNFFVVMPPGVLETYPATYVSALHVPAAQRALMDELVRAFPNILVIDVETILAQVQRIMDQVIKAVEFVFIFGLLAGIIVLFAAIHATHDERIRDAAVLRTLGATREQLRAAQAAEFIVIGALAGVLAALGATVVGYFVAERVLNVPYQASFWAWPLGLMGGAAGVLAVGLLGTRRLAQTSPMEIFRAAA